MSTIDLQTSRKLVAGEYKSDGYVAIIIYANMFGGISFKACKKGQASVFMDQFSKNGWPNDLIWLRTNESKFDQAEMDHFNKMVELFADNNPKHSRP